MIELTCQYRQILLSVRDSAHVLVEPPPTTPFRLKLIKKISDLFAQLGMKQEDIFSVSWILNNYVTSFVIEEYRMKEFADEKVNAALAEGLPFDVSKIDMEKEFRFGLEVLMEGFKSKAN
ncbi:TetR/AcrR family transcriptional regulator C-terminal domain-containing protein [Brevibacillus agri]|uniref:TetR/AcrR family transcriptional regulator C-terminal domain-containing protein n=1 Tax=Brevibacillus agri TaxID=51101 RepID=UPI0004724300|nr:TetR/AcrR family transcriptional regulator C-terminal domain-containing protein [Brevibacillus agri]